MTAELSTAYSDHNVLFRVLGHLGWGELVNVGYSTLDTLPAAGFQGLAPSQRRLLGRVLGLLAPQPGERVLDACCGRGLATAWLGEHGCEAVGLDLQPQQIDQARLRFHGAPRVSFAVADVTALPARAGDVDLPSGGFDRVLSLEAAFHFGPAGRRAFLAESFRLLRPGGRLVLVDFTWPGAMPGPLAELDPNELVRQAWHFADLEPLDRYLATARDTGFRVRAVHDWTRNAIHHQLLLARAAGVATGTALGRRLACLRFPGLRELSPADWRAFGRSVAAHWRFFREVGYSVLVLDKP